LFEENSVIFNMHEQIIFGFELIWHIGKITLLKYSPILWYRRFYDAV